MMTSSNGNIFRVTSHLCGEFFGHQWIARTKASDAELWFFSLICTWINGWVNNRRAHYDVTVMMSRTSGPLCGLVAAVHNKLIDLEAQHFKWGPDILKTMLNTLRPRQNGVHIADDLFKCIFLNGNVWLNFHRSLFLRVQLTIFQHWFK